MSDSIVALYDNVQNAEAAVAELQDAGIEASKISVLAKNEETAEALAPEEPESTGEKAGKAAVTGAVTGGILGGLGALVVGLSPLAIPAFGAVLVAGPIATALASAGIGAVGGGLVGALVGWGLPREKAEYYVDEIRKGAIVIAVDTPDADAESVRNILSRNKCIGMECSTLQC